MASALTLPVLAVKLWDAAEMSPTFAAGCSTSKSFKMVAPSFVMVTSPMSSTSICTRGDLMTSDHITIIM